jgi:hypothetical protein
MTFPGQFAVFDQHGTQTGDVFGGHLVGDIIIEGRLGGTESGRADGEQE